MAAPACSRARRQGAGRAPPAGDAQPRLFWQALRSTMGARTDVFRSGGKTLPAGCLAAVWAARPQQRQGWRLGPGGIETALRAAVPIRDETLQRKS